MHQPERVRAHVRLAGRVQRVGFRYAALDEARARRLAGWVRNLDSGAVEAVFEGAPADVQALVRWCGEGPPGAYVRHVDVAWDEPPERLTTFEMRPTGSG